MARGRSGNKYQKQSILQQKLNALKGQVYEPTSDINGGNYDGTSLKSRHLDETSDVSLSPVRPSETPFERFKRRASEYGSILAWLGVFVTAATTLLYLNYDISHIKEDVQKLETDVKSTTDKIINVERLQYKNEQELVFVNEKISKIEKTTDTNQNDIKNIIINKSRK